MKKLLFIFLALALVVTGCAGAGSSADRENTVVVSGKKFSEQVVLAHTMAKLLEDRTDLKVVTKADLGATDVLQQGMKDGDIDVYAEYTGTAYMIVMKEELDTTEPDVIYDRVKKYYDEELNVSWLEPFDLNNTYATAVRGDLAEELGLEKTSDLVPHAPEMILGSDFDFLEREDGITNYNKVYGLTWKDNRGMDPGLMYSAAKEKQVDAIIAYATDGRIPNYDLKILEDDKQFFPPYYAAPIVRNEVLEKHPEVADALNELAPHLTSEKMAELNARVDIDGEPAEKVAEDFLNETGLVTK